MIISNPIVVSKLVMIAQCVLNGFGVELGVTTTPPTMLNILFSAVPMKMYFPTNLTPKCRVRLFNNFGIGYKKNVHLFRR